MKDVFDPKGRFFRQYHSEKWGHQTVVGIKNTRNRIVYKLIAAGLLSQKDASVSVNSTVIKKMRNKLISMSGFIICLVMMFGLISRNILRWQNSTSLKVS